MREIKFRGKKVNDGEFVCGSLFTLEDKERTAYFIEVDNNCKKNKNVPKMGILFTLNYDVYMIDPNTIGQFTGLYDKNGKEIYEGDVLKHDSSTFSGIVAWNSKGYFYIKEEHILFHDEEPSCTPLGEMIEREDFVVIGDIHEK